MTIATTTTAREALTIARILKVNHAGEYGAIRIYQAQIFVARGFYPDLLPFLQRTLAHEINHCASFRGAMPARGARPCRVMSLWGNGGLLLGLFTALLGRQGVWICTAAVESAVHRHLDDQLYFLRNRDPELFALIAAIQTEELEHLDHAEHHIVGQTWWSHALHDFVWTTTDILIWLSTWGDSTKMARDLAEARARFT